MPGGCMGDTAELQAAQAETAQDVREELATPEVTRLRDLAFMDLYIRLDAREIGRYRPIATRAFDPPNLPVPESLVTEIDELRRALIPIERDQLSFTYDGTRMRVSRQRMVTGEIWAVMRRVANEIPTLEGLHIPSPLIPVMRKLGQRQGLIIICGATGHGKTTTATALLSGFLTRFGSVAYTIEDPVEYMMQGQHGESGYCFQVEVNADEEWGDALKTALRWHPRYILVGEIRSSEAANQLLRAATSGHLVITTMHAGSIEEALTALMQMAELQLGNRAAGLLADSLVAVFHQRLENPAEGPQLRFVVTEEDNMGDPVRAAVRANKIALLGTYIERQAALLARKIDPATASRG